MQENAKDLLKVSESGIDETDDVLQDANTTQTESENPIDLESIGNEIVDFISGKDSDYSEISEWLIMIEELGEQDASILESIILDELKERVLPGYDTVETLNDVIQVYQFYLSHEDKVDKLTSNEELNQAMLNGNIPRITRELMDIYLANKWPDYYEYKDPDPITTNPTTWSGGYTIKDRTTGEQLKDFGSVVFGWLPFIPETEYSHEVLDDYRTTLVIQQLIVDLINDSHFESSNIIEAIDNAIELAKDMAYYNLTLDKENETANLTIDASLIAEIAYPLVVSVLNSFSSHPAINETFSTELTIEAGQAIFSIAVNFIPGLSTAFVIEDIYNYFTEDDKDEGVYSKDTNLDLFAEQLGELPGTISRISNGIRYTWSPLFPDSIMVDNMSPLYQGKIIRVDHLDPSLITRMISKVPTTGKYSKMGKAVVAIGGALYKPVANFVTANILDVDGLTFNERKLNFEYEYSREVELMNEALEIANQTEVMVKNLVSTAISTIGKDVILPGEDSREMDQISDQDLQDLTNLEVDLDDPQTNADSLVGNDTHYDQVEEEIDYDDKWENYYTSFKL